MKYLPYQRPGLYLLQFGTDGVFTVSEDLVCSFNPRQRVGDKTVRVAGLATAAAAISQTRTHPRTIKHLNSSATCS
jgi:hypothetical protein